MYAIVQGLKMGIILLTTQKNNNINYIMHVSTALEPTQLYFQKTEGLCRGLSNIIMSLKLCADNIHFYWYIDNDNKDNSDLKFISSDVI